MKFARSILFLICLGSGMCFAQIPNTGLVTVSRVTQNANVAIDFATIDFNTTGSGGVSNVLEAGMPYPGAGNSMWINYTYRQDGSNTNSPAAITVLANGIPAGVILTLVPMSISNSNLGTMNTVNRILQNNVPYQFITNIIPGYSGNGINNGFEVSYLIANPNNKSLNGISVEYSITY